MSNAINTAITGLNGVAQRIANAATSIVNASSTNAAPKNANALSSKNNAGGGDLAGNLLAIKVDQVNYGADAAVIKVAQKNAKTLLDIVS